MQDTGCFVMIFLICSITLRSWVNGDTCYTFQSKSHTYEVRVGSVIDLECAWKDSDDTVIILKGTSVTGRNLTQIQPSTKYIFTWDKTQRLHDVLVKLTINVTDRSDGGLYVCRKGRSFFKQLVLTVLYAPKDPPICSTSCQGTCFLPNGQRESLFSCITPEGNPPVNVSLFLNNQLVMKNVTINQKHIGDDEEKVWSYSLVLDQSFNYTYMNCVVTQPVNASYVSYEEWCTYGPIIVVPPIDSSPASLTTAFEKDKTTMVTSKIPEKVDFFMSNMFSVVVIGLVLILLPLIYFSMKLTYVKYNNKNNRPLATHLFHDQPGEITPSTIQNGNNNPFTNGSNVDINNEDFFQGMDMVNNLIYVSGNREDSENMLMVRNAMYDSASDHNINAMETGIYTKIERY